MSNLTPMMVSDIAFSIGLVLAEAVGFFVVIPRLVLWARGVEMRFPTVPVIAYLASDLILQVAADLGFIDHDWSQVLSMALVIALVLFIGAGNVRFR